MSENSKNIQKYPNRKIFNCQKCNFICSKSSIFNKHLLTQKHNRIFKEINGDENSKNIQNTKMNENSKNYSCSYCNFFTKKPSAFNKHINTIKHKENINPNLANMSKYKCQYCEKEYNKKNSCMKHEKTCSSNDTINDSTNDSTNTELIKPTPELSYISNIFNRLIQENQKLSSFIIEQSQVITEQNKSITEQNKEFMKKITDLTINNTINHNNTIHNTNNNNNKFNIHVFLNEKCKDAINFSDFLENIEVSHEDLENNAQLGFVNGISKIIMDNLNQLSIYERPIHCTDVKRETMYIKDENKWEKEDTAKLSNAIRQVSRKSMASLSEWKEENHECQDMDSDFSNKCITITQQSIAGMNRDIFYPKIIRNLAKETVIDKKSIE